MINIGKTIIATVQSLDWLKPYPIVLQTKADKIENSNSCNLMNYQDYDVILGSDIVYERTLILPLCKILKSYLCDGENKKFKSIAYIACTERSYTTLECFEVILHQKFLL